VWIWYPAERAGDARASDYLPAFWRTAVARDRAGGSIGAINDLLTHDSVLVRTHSVPDLPVSLEQRSYPVVVIRAGSGALVADYTTLAEDLASHGYIVVGFDAPYRTRVVLFRTGVFLKESRNSILRL
jgi:predicted dienelactone hydrolase